MKYGVVVPTLFNLPFWPMQMTHLRELSWILIYNNQVIAPTLAAVPNIVFLLEQIHRDSSIWFTAIDLAMLLYFILISKVHKVQFSFL